MQEAMPENYAQGVLAGGQLGMAVMEKTRRLDVTVRQNLDARIKEAEARVAQLKEVRDRMEASGLLEVRIHDITEALRW